MAIDYDALRKRAKKKDEEWAERNLPSNNDLGPIRKTVSSDDLGPVRKTVSSDDLGPVRPTASMQFQTPQDVNNRFKNTINGTSAEAKTLKKAAEDAKRKNAQKAQAEHEELSKLTYNQIKERMAANDKEYAELKKKSGGGKAYNKIIKAANTLMPNESSGKVKAQADITIKRMEELVAEKEKLQPYYLKAAQNEKLSKLDNDVLKALDNINDSNELEDGSKWNQLLSNFAGATTAPSATDLYSHEANKNLQNSNLEFLYKKGYSYDEIKELADLRKRQVNEERQTEQTAGAHQFAQEHPIAASTLARGSNFLGGITGPLEFTRQILDPNKSQYGIDQNAAGYQLTRTAGAIDEQIQLDHDFIIGGVDVFDLFYSAGSSIVDNTLRAVAGGGRGAGALMAGQVFTQSLIESKDKGYSDSKALSKALVSATIEGITEELSLEVVLKPNDAKGVIGKMLKSALAEGSEEVASNWLNNIYEVVVNGSQSDIEKTMQSYIDSGMSNREAAVKTIGDLVAEDGEAFLVGALSGGIMGGGAHIMQGGNKTKYLKENYDKGLYNFISETINGERTAKSFYKFSNKINSKLANDIETLVGFSVKDYSNEIGVNDIKHIIKRHGKNGQADNSLANIEDFANLKFVIENYDDIRLGKGTKAYRNKDGSLAKTVEMQKQIDERYYYVVEAVPDNKKKTLRVVSAYINKNDTFSQVAVENSPSRYAQNEPESNVSENSISHFSGNSQAITDTEKKVVDAETNNRIKEEEQEGQKLSDKEKKSIRKAVINDLEKGRISTDTIESVLGGETYQKYKNSVDSRESLKKELNELRQMKSGEMNDIQKDRLAELKAMNLDDTSESDKLKSQLGNEVYALAKESSKLNESYNEKSRRSQNYEADISKYDKAQQETIKNAVESGVLNNTNRTHEFVDMIAKVSAEKGVLFDFTDNEKLKNSGFALEGKSINGYVSDNKVTVNIQSAKALNAVIGHEITHILEGTEHYSALQEAVKQYAESKGEYDTRLQSIAKLYENVEGANVENELTADLIGDYLFSDENFIKNLSSEKPNLFKKIFNEIKYLCKTVTAGTKEAKQLLKVKRAFEKAYQANNEQKNNTDTNDGVNSTNIKFSLDFDKYPYNMQTVIKEYIESVDNDIVDFVNDAKAEENKKRLEYMHRDIEITNADILNAISRLVNFDVSKFKTRINGETIKHIDRRHGANGKHDYSMKDVNDIARVAYVFNNADDVEQTINSKGNIVYSKQYRNKDNTPSPVITVSKKINGTYYIALAVPDSNSKCLHIISAYISNKKEFVQEFDDNLPKPTPEANLESNSNNNIPNLTEKVKQKQLKIINESNPAPNTYNTWIRDTKDIKTFEQALNDEEYADYDEFNPDFTRAMAEEALESGEITVYSSYPINNGAFVTPSRMEAESYSGSGQVYEKTVALNDVAWIDITQGQYAKVDDKFSLSEQSGDIAPVKKYGNYNVYGKDIALEKANQNEDIAPIGENVKRTAKNSFTSTDEDIAPANAQSQEKISEKAYDKNLQDENDKLPTRKEVHEKYIDELKTFCEETDMDLDEVLDNAKPLSTISKNFMTPARVNDKVFGYENGEILNKWLSYKDLQSETDGIKWLNGISNRQTGLLAQLSNEYNIKPGSKESAAAQMYAEGFYVNKEGDYCTYSDAELAQDFKEVYVRERIKGLANDQRIRKFYDDSLDKINRARNRNGYESIPRRDNYFLHFITMEDYFSKLGTPFNPNDIRMKDLPTDINGMTTDLKPGKPYFASENHRSGKRTTYDLLGGIEKYAVSAQGQIFRIDGIQRYRALRNYIADRYGQAKGFENADELSPIELEERMQQIYDGHLSSYAAYLNEQANILAGKTPLIDRGVEAILGRRGLTFMKNLTSQVGKNLVGFNMTSPFTNLIAQVQAMASTNKASFIKGFSRTVYNKLSLTVKHQAIDNFAEINPTVIRRKGADKFSRTPFEKVGDVGYWLMGAIDDFSTEVITRAKTDELMRKHGMSESEAMYNADIYASRLMADRSVGQMPQIFNSSTLGMITQFQLESLNQIYSGLYDTFAESKFSYRDVENKYERNIKTIAKATSIMTQLAVGAAICGLIFEKIFGYDPTFNIISTIITALGWDDEDDSEDTPLDNLGQAFLELLDDMPFGSIITGGGRIPITDALPTKLDFEDENGNLSVSAALKSLGSEAARIAPYYFLPGGYGQIKKSFNGLKMFDKDLPVSGSYTDSGALRYPVEKTLWNVAQAAVFGQYANKNAREYFDNDIAPIKKEDIEQYQELGLPIEQYRKIQNELKAAGNLTDKNGYTRYSDKSGNVYWYDKDTQTVYDEDYNEADISILDLDKVKSTAEQLEYIDSLPISNKQKNILYNDIATVEKTDRYGYEKYTGMEINEDGELKDGSYYYDAKHDTYYNSKYEQVSRNSIYGLTPVKDRDMSNYSKFSEYEEFDLYNRNPEKYKFLKSNGISYAEYTQSKEKKEAYDWAYEAPERITVAKVFDGDIVKLKSYTDELNGFKADKDSNGKSITGSKKKKILKYVNDLNEDYYAKLILFKMKYNSDDTYNYEIIDYLNGRNDISYSEMETVLRELGFKVDSKGNITW